MLTLQNPPHTVDVSNKGNRYVKGAARNCENIAHLSVRVLTSNHAPSTFGGFFMAKEKVIAHDTLRFVDGAFR